MAWLRDRAPQIPCPGVSFPNQFRSHVTITTWLIAGALALVVSCSRQPARKYSREQPKPSSSLRQILTGRVVAIGDGDTITVLDTSTTQHRIRLAGIDAPESHQAFGEQSKRNLADMVFGKEVSVSYQKVDQYGRIVGQVRLDGKDINLEQVKAGMAWHYKYYEDEQPPEERGLYAKAEEDARTAGRGLWQDPNPVGPYQFRRDHRERQDAR